MTKILENKMKCSKKNAGKKLRKYLSKPEVEVLAASCIKLPRNVLRNRLMIWTMFYFGLRTTELIQLRWSDINFSTGEIFIRRLKNGRDRLQIIADTKYKRLLKQHHKQCVKDGRLDHVFTTQSGNAFCRTSIHHLIQKLGVLSNFPFVLHPHMLRHSLGYYLANNNVPTHTIQEFLGHASITNTVKYIEMNPDVFRKTWQQLGVR